MRLTAADLAGQGAALVAPPKRRVFPGHPRQAAHARRFVARALDGCPATDTAVLLTSELVTNALAHTPSSDGGSFEVIVWRGAAAVCIAVLDAGSGKTPAAGGVDPGSESGRGLSLVAMLAASWGHDGGTAGRAVWFLLRWHDE
jgi:anti-sigma regulatory factor (Ser/Thr protein kinase)